MGKKYGAGRVYHRGYRVAGTNPSAMCRAGSVAGVSELEAVGSRRMPDLPQGGFFGGREEGVAMGGTWVPCRS